MTRKDYLDGKVTHREYYASIIEEAGIQFKENAEIVDRCRHSDDLHYNDIPLREWDWLASLHRSGLLRAFNKHDDFYSDAGGVCAMKEAVRQAVEMSRGETA